MATKQQAPAQPPIDVNALIQQALGGQADSAFGGNTGIAATLAGVPQDLIGASLIVGQPLSPGEATQQFGRFQGPQQDSGPRTSTVRDVMADLEKMAYDDPKKYQSIQQALYSGHFYGPSYYTKHPRTPSFGLLTDDDRAAYRDAVLEATRTNEAGLNLTLDDIIKRGSSSGLSAIEDARQTRQGALGGPTADVAAQVDKLQTLAGDYLVPISQSTIHSWINRGATEGDFQAYLKDMAKGRFTDPNVQGAIDRGISPKMYFEPLVQAAARELEVAPDSIDLTNSKWSSLTGVRDDKGQIRAMTLNEAQNFARQMPEWQHTTGALDMASKAAQGIAKMWGALG